VLSVLKVLVQQIDVLAVRRSVGPLCDRPVASRATWCEVEGVKGYIDCHTEFDCDIVMGFMFALSKFGSQNSTQKIT